MHSVFFERMEKTYQTDQKKAILYKEKSDKNGVKICFYSIPDRNKQRMSIARKITTITLQEDYEKFLVGIGYKNTRTRLVEGYRYYRNGYIIELSKMKRASDIQDSSEEEILEEVEQNIPEFLYEFYLVKVFVNTENPVEGEEILNMAFNELSDVVKVIKPSVQCFI